MAAVDLVWVKCVVAVDMTVTRGRSRICVQNKHKPQFLHTPSSVISLFLFVMVGLRQEWTLSKYDPIKLSESCEVCLRVLWDLWFLLTMRNHPRKE